MAPQMSPLPQWSSFQEPDPSSDEDLVLNEPVRNSRRKRKNTGSAASHEPKRPKLVDIEKIIASSSRTNNAAAGGSGGRIPSARRSKSPSSRYGTNPRAAQLSTGNKVQQSRHSAPQPVISNGKQPSESVATARTKVVKRTRKEKQRQRSSSSSGSLPDASMLASLSQKSNSFPSASAPVPKRGEGYQREALRDRFSSTKSAPVKDRKTDKTGDVIEILDSDEEPSEPKLGKPKRTKLKSTLNKDSAIIEVVSDSDDLEFRRRSEISAARKFQPRKSIPQDSQDIIILDSDDDPPLPTADSQNDNAGEVPITMKPELTHDDSRSNCISGPAPSESHESPGVSHEKDNRIVHDSSIPSPLPDPVEDEASVGMGFDGGDIVLRDASPPHAKDDDSITPPPFVSTPWSASGPVLKDSVVPDVGISKVPPLTSNAATGSSFISTQPLPQRRSPGSLSPSPSTVIVHPRPQEQGGLSDPIVSISEPSLLNVAPSTSPVSSVATHPIAHVSEAPSNSPERSKSRTFSPPLPGQEPSPLSLLFRPNGLLSPHPNDGDDFDVSPKSPKIQASVPSPLPPPQLPAPTPPSAHQPLHVKPKPPSHRRQPLPLPRPSQVVDTSVSSDTPPQPSSPYKIIRDGALSTSAAALRRKLGLSLPREDTHPRLDLRTPPVSAAKHPLPKKRPRQSGSNTSPSLSVFRLPAPLPSQGTPSEGSPRPSSPEKGASSVSVLSKRLPPKQRSLVEAINSTGLHNSQPVMALSKRPLSPLQRPPSVSSQAQVSATPPSSAPQAEEEVPGASAALISDIIDLTLSDHEGADSARATAEATSAPIRPLPRSATQSIEEAREMQLKRLTALISRSGTSVSASATRLSADTQSPSVTVNPQVKMDGDDSALRASQVLNEAYGMNGLENSPATDQSHLPPPAPSPPPDVAAENMEVDSEPPPILTSSESQSGGGASNSTTCSPPPPSGITPAPLPDTAEENPSATDIERESTKPFGPQSDSSMASTPETVDEQVRMTLMKRRSYDDTEYYELEYFDPPPNLPTPESQEVAVENLHPAVTDESLVNSPATDEPLVEPRDASVNPERASDDEEGPSFSASGSAPSPKLALRRSSRRSSYSSSTDPLDLLHHDSDDDLSLDGPDYDVPLSPLSDSDNGMADDSQLIEVEKHNPYPVMTWESYRQDLANFVPRSYYAKDLVSVMHDYINALDPYTRSSPHMRHVFESAIRENTGEDEPDAPLIQVINDVDDDPTPPWEFYYTNRIWLGEGVDPPDITQLVGCDCKGKCDPKSKTCACLKRQLPYFKDVYTPGFAYDNKGRLRTPGTPIFECNALCACDDDECKNRVVQHGRKCAVEIRKTPRKGWGVFAAKKIPKGTFIGVYSGEFLRDDVSEQRGIVYDKSGRTYLLDVDFYYLKESEGWEVRYVVDAYHAGNFTRFLNNSCNPNCKVAPCYIDEPNLEKPLLTLFSTRDIAADEELCFSYKGRDPLLDDDDDNERIGPGHSIRNECLCGAENCDGFMFG